MRLALRAARRARRTSPNPRVGAVVVRAGEVVGVGYHRRAGAPHAEPAALEAAGERARGATVYVTLEPCNHHGRTPPCTEALIEAGVREVVVGYPDPKPHVAGATARLEAAGVRVIHGPLRRECQELVADFETLITKGRPHVTLKAAVTLDGKMATRTRDSKWITGAAARTEAHRLRARHDAILVGVGTVLADDPTLDVRRCRGRNPTRVVFDTRLRTPPGARVVTAPTGAPTILIHTSAAPGDRRQELRAAGAELVEVPAGPDGGVALGPALAALGARDVMRLLVEGGPRLHGALLDGGYAERAAVFVAPRVLGDAEALGFAAGRGVDRVALAARIEAPRVRRLGVDVLIEGPLTRGTE